MDQLQRQVFNLTYISMLAYLVPLCEIMLCEETLAAGRLSSEFTDSMLVNESLLVNSALPRPCHTVHWSDSLPRLPPHTTSPTDTFQIKDQDLLVLFLSGAGIGSETEFIFIFRIFECLIVVLCL